MFNGYEDDDNYDDEPEWFDDDDYERYGTYFEVNRVQALLLHIRRMALKLGRFLFELRYGKSDPMDDIPF